MLDPHQLFRAIVLLNGLFASLAWCLARTNWASMLSVLTFAVLWPLFDKPLGGRTVFVLNESNGITTGDFLSAFAVLVVAALGAMRLRRLRRNSELSGSADGTVRAALPDLDPGRDSVSGVGSAQL